MKTLNTCSGCLHWKRYKTPEEGGQCTSPKLAYDGSNPPPDGLHYWDFEDYSAGMATGPDFGCIHWSKRQ